MPSSSSPPPSGDLLARCIEVFELEGPEALDAMLVGHADQAASIRQQIDLLVGIGIIDPHKVQPEVPDQLGPFQLKGRIGGGGMGVVYRAVQDPLGREVALKLIRPDSLYFEEMRDRFHREIEVISSLQHPGIVPVFVSGSERGIPYYAMELIQGRSLADCLKELETRRPASLSGRDLRAALGLPARRDVTSSDSAAIFHLPWVEVCFRIVMRAAEALGYAHQRGILHRDIKPSNIMLDHHGRVMLVDFGLAGLEGSQRLTRSDAQIGSLAYMAPEQLLGEVSNIDARTDLYGLGVTLYELLTLKAPHLSNRPEETRRRILEGAPLSPRQLNPEIPWDAETVCLTAMERDAGRRYPSAEAFVDDVRRFLEHQVIHARRPGPLLRTRRFLQRHPTASTGALLGILLVLASLMYAFEQNRIGRALQVAVEQARTERKNALDSAEEAKESALVAERNFQRSFDAANRLVRIGFEKLANVPGFESIQEELLVEADQLYRSFQDEQHVDPIVRLEMARTHRLLGQLKAEANDLRGAQQGYRRSIELLDALTEEDPENPDYRWQLSTCHQQLGILMSRLGEHALAATHMEQAVAIATQLMQDRPGTTPPGVRLAHAMALMNLANVYMNSGRMDAAEEWLGRAYDYTVSLIADHPTAPHRSLLAVIRINQGQILLGAGQADEALDTAWEAVDLCEALLVDAPRDADHRHRLCEGLSLVTNANHAREDHEAAIDAALQASHHARELRTSFPQNHAFHELLCRVLLHLGINQLTNGDREDARDTLRETQQEVRRLVAAANTALALRFELQTQRWLGDALRALEDPDGAEQAFQGALRVWERVVEEQRESSVGRGEAETAIQHYAELLRSLGRAEEADRLTRKP